MNPITIQSYSVGDENKIHDLIKTVYDEFVAPDYTLNGNAFFYTYIQPSNFVQRFTITKNIIVTAIADSQIVGMIEIRGTNMVSLLFVQKEFHKQGVARALLKEALSQIRLRKPDLSELHVHASPYSISVYENLGFVGVGDLQEDNGIKYLAMKETLP